MFMCKKIQIYIAIYHASVQYFYHLIQIMFIHIMSMSLSCWCIYFRWKTSKWLLSLCNYFYFITFQYSNQHTVFACLYISERTTANMAQYYSQHNVCAVWVRECACVCPSVISCSLQFFCLLIFWINIFSFMFRLFSSPPPLIELMSLLTCPLLLILDTISLLFVLCL